MEKYVKNKKNKEKKMLDYYQDEDGEIYAYYKNEPTDKIWWVDYYNYKGINIFTFDKKKFFYMWSDYPYKLTPEEIEIFDKENPYWADFFSPRKEEMKKQKKVEQDKK